MFVVGSVGGCFVVIVVGVAIDVLSLLLMLIWCNPSQSINVTTTLVASSLDIVIICIAQIWIHIAVIAIVGINTLAAVINCHHYYSWQSISSITHERVHVHFPISW